MDVHTGFERLKALAAADTRILGLIVGGSRGKGFENVHSDYDVTVVVADDAAAELRAPIEEIGKGNDFDVVSRSEFQDLAAWGSTGAWQRYNFAHLRVDPDRTGGELQRLVDEKALVPDTEVEKYIEASLDGFLNQVYRSLKAQRSGCTVAQRLEAAEGIRGLLQALFCLHDRRVLPYYKYLEWELAERPLYLLQISGERLVELAFETLDSGSREAQQTLLREAERAFRPRGYGRVFDGWGDALPWMRDFAG